LTSEQLSPNMTEEILEKVFDVLPDKMDDGELCALTLSIYSAYIDDESKIMGELATLLYAFGSSMGLSKAAISEGLRRMADIYGEETAKVH
jgi:hypothetical protein